MLPFGMGRDWRTVSDQFEKSSRGHLLGCIKAVWTCVPFCGQPGHLLETFAHGGPGFAQPGCWNTSLFDFARDERKRAATKHEGCGINN